MRWRLALLSTLLVVLSGCEPPRTDVQSPSDDGQTTLFDVAFDTGTSTADVSADAAVPSDTDSAFDGGVKADTDAVDADSSSDDGVDSSSADTTGPDSEQGDVLNQPMKPTSPWTWKIRGDDVLVTWKDLPDQPRQWTVKTTHALKDAQPPSSQRTFSAPADGPTLTTDHPGLDSMYALALHEVALNSVSGLTDDAFNQGKPVPCPCFATGAKWPWAWTRDTAYAVALGLADVALERSRATLLFKTSKKKTSLGGGAPEVVQDTGTGGSWPVSSDRVVWAVGAAAVHARLSGAAASTFAKEAATALHNTLVTDRAVTFDAKSGLYRGEQSFLDWREQSYPSWTKGNVTPIAEGKALSTNVLYWYAHTWVSERYEALGEADLAKKHQQWAAALKAAVLERFKVTGSPMLAALVGGHFDPSATHRFELLGLALAVELGMVSSETGHAMLSQWPWSPSGPPVQWPQQPDTPIYHNRAIWPFVTAWATYAGARSEHGEVVWRGLNSLYELAALNLSHMENFEFLTGKNWYDAGTLSGPVVNSQRQLWSVAGAIGVVHEVLFGVRQRAGQVRFEPRVPTQMRDDWITWSGQPKLSGLNVQGVKTDVTLHWPKGAGPAGMFKVTQLTVNGAAKPLGQWLSVSQLGATADVHVYLQWPAVAATAAVPTLASDAPPSQWMAPKEPAAPTLKLSSGQLSVSWPSVGGATSYDLYIDGALAKEALGATAWTHALKADTTPCFSVVARADALRSHHSPATCWWGSGYQRIQSVSAYNLTGAGWGGMNPAHLKDVQPLTNEALQIHHLRPKHSGPHDLQLVYRNDAANVTTGVTAATVRVQIQRLKDDADVLDAVLVLPQNGAQFVPSTTASCTLSTKETYRLLVSAPSGLPNMTALEHYTVYNGGPGGGSAAYMRFDLAEVKLLSRQGPKDAYDPLVKPDGVKDLDKMGQANQAIPGVPLASWERVAITWDERFIWLSVVTKAFEQGVKPFIAYMAPDVGVAKASSGMTYLNQTSALPFAPKFAVGVRSTTDNGDGYGPWSGVFERVGTSWKQRLRFEPGVNYWLTSDKHTITVRVPRAMIEATGPTRLTGHVVWAEPGNEWKATIPAKATPWSASGASYLVIDPAAKPGTQGWVTK